MFTYNFITNNNGIGTVQANTIDEAFNMLATGTIVFLSYHNTCDISSYQEYQDRVDINDDY